MELMDGVQIIEQVEKTKNVLSFSTPGVILIAAGILLVALSIKLATVNDIKIKWVILFLFIGVFLVVGVFIYSDHETPTGKYTYYVTISDDVSFNQFRLKYEIIDYDGQIYHIEEK